MVIYVIGVEQNNRGDLIYRIASRNKRAMALTKVDGRDLLHWKSNFGMKIVYENIATFSTYSDYMYEMIKERDLSKSIGGKYIDIIDFPTEYFGDFGKLDEKANIDTKTVTAKLVSGTEIIAYEVCDIYGHTELIPKQSIRNRRLTNDINSEFIVSIEYTKYEASKKILRPGDTVTIDNYTYRFLMRQIEKYTNCLVWTNFKEYPFGWGISIADHSEYNPNDKLRQNIDGFPVTHLDNLFYGLNEYYVKLDISNNSILSAVNILGESRVGFLDLRLNPAKKLKDINIDIFGIDIDVTNFIIDNDRIGDFEYLISTTSKRLYGPDIGKWFNEGNRVSYISGDNITNLVNKAKLLGVKGKVFIVK